MSSVLTAKRGITHEIGLPPIQVTLEPRITYYPAESIVTAQGVTIYGVLSYKCALTAADGHLINDDELSTRIERINSQRSSSYCRHLGAPHPWQEVASFSEALKDMASKPVLLAGQKETFRCDGYALKDPKGFHARCSHNGITNYTDIPPERAVQMFCTNSRILAGSGQKSQEHTKQEWEWMIPRLNDDHSKLCTEIPFVSSVWDECVSKVGAEFSARYTD